MRVDMARGKTLDKLGQLRCITRKRFKTVNLPYGWKLVKEELDSDYRKRIYNILSESGRCNNE